MLPVKKDKIQTKLLSARCRRRIGAILLAISTLGTFSPVRAHAIGCGDTQSVTITDPSQLGMDSDGNISSGIFAGTATKVGSGLFHDTFSFTAIDIVSGDEISGTYQVSTVGCLTMSILGTPYVATNVVIDVLNR